MTGAGTHTADRAQWLLRTYYAATALFLLLDYAFGINVRIAFLERHDALRLAYYLFCFTCLALMLWRPSITVVVGAFESLVALVALILSFWMRVMQMSNPDSAPSQPVLGIEELANFVLSGFIAYFAWWRGVRELQGRRSDP